MASQKGFFDENREDKKKAGIDSLDKYKHLEEILMLCSVFNCSEDEALNKDDDYLTAIICRNIENRIFGQKYNRLLKSKRKGK